MNETPDQSFEQTSFEQRKRQSFLQVLFKTARLANEQAIERAQAVTGDDRLSQAHTSLFPHISSEGIRLTTLAERLGISKQAVGQLVDDLEDMALVERVPDPSDGRAKLIRWTPGGREGLDAGLALLGELQAELAEVVGSDALQQAHQVLLRLLDHLEEHETSG